ncbi:MULTISPECIES: hypothetical protein [unclassified Paenibacillus]|uniref:hypothetical protein n=1 Tax=unclassified Paenibacillus TaxID=185978 RepID=UPI001AEB4BE8|nr:MULTISPECIES: hypothetical protein [unclassified Paenibacillus]MBP1155414.1 hypothetical protein [Paenibacillus sp. PvP091]MBP1169201.1 hypothetical protein [Paenibacillus sp. PvR098]MBP2440229.1 hypothetical protein [Paenibacillus sp. PvP052]
MKVPLTSEQEVLRKKIEEKAAELRSYFSISRYERDFSELVRNEQGWHVSHLSYSEQGGRDAEPILGVVLRHDSVSYPRNLSSLMEDIWNRAEDEGLTHEEVQQMLNDVADWISLTERNYPDHIAR